MVAISGASLPRVAEPERQAFPLNFSPLIFKILIMTKPIIHHKSKKPGRPKLSASQLRAKTISVHCSEKDCKFIKYQADRYGHSAGDFCLRAALDVPVKERIDKPTMEYLRYLYGIANNLNQAMHAAHTARLEDDEEKFKRALDEILRLINNVRNS